MWLVLRNPNEGLCGQIPNIALRAIASLYIKPVPLIWNREEKEVRGPTLHRVYCVSSVVLLGRDTGLPHLLAPNLLTGGKGADLVIRGDVVLNSWHPPIPMQCKFTPCNHSLYSKSGLLPLPVPTARSVTPAFDRTIGCQSPCGPSQDHRWLTCHVTRDRKRVWPGPRGDGSGTCAPMR
jgi:hypothetical protein